MILVSNGAVVDLGLLDRCQFVLLHSPVDPPNRRFKIAVVSEDRRGLVSVWERDYGLPDGLKKITRQMENWARVLAKPFFTLRITVRVYEGRQSFWYEKDVGEVISEDDRLESVLEILKPQLAPIARIVEEKKKNSNSRARYGIIVFNPCTRGTAEYRIRHKEIMRRIVA